MKKLLAFIVLSLLWSGNAHTEVKYQKTELKIDDLVLQGYTLFAAQLEGNAIGNGVYVLTKTLKDKQSIFHCYVAMKGVPQKVETCYNLTPSVD